MNNIEKYYCEPKNQEEMDNIIRNRAFFAKEKMETEKLLEKERHERLINEAKYYDIWYEFKYMLNGILTNPNTRYNKDQLDVLEEMHKIMQYMGDKLERYIFDKRLI